MLYYVLLGCGLRYLENIYVYSEYFAQCLSILRLSRIQVFYLLMNCDLNTHSKVLYIFITVGLLYFGWCYLYKQFLLNLRRFSSKYHKEFKEHCDAFGSVFIPSNSMC